MDYWLKDLKDRRQEDYKRNVFPLKGERTNGAEKEGVNSKTYCCNCHILLLLNNNDVNSLFFT